MGRPTQKEAACAWVFPDWKTAGATLLTAPHAQHHLCQPTATPRRTLPRQPHLVQHAQTHARPCPRPPAQRVWPARTFACLRARADVVPNGKRRRGARTVTVLRKAWPSASTSSTMSSSSAASFVIVESAVDSSAVMFCRASSVGRRGQARAGPGGQATCGRRPGRRRLCRQ